MKKKIFLILSLVLIVTLVTLLIFYKKGYIFNEEEEDKTFKYSPLTYEICDENSCIYLLGSIHLGDERVTKFNSSIMNYYNKSKYLAVELDTKNISIDYTEFVEDFDKSIEDILGEELSKKLEMFLIDKNSMISFEQLKMFKLGFIYDYLSLISATELGLTSPGVDEYFLSLAHTENKEIIELETYEEQLDLLLNYRDEFYKNQINDSIDNYDTSKELLRKLYEAYLSADEENLKELINEDETSNDEPLTEEEKRYQNSMLYDRNIKMTENAKNFLKEDKEVFMIVGLAHVIGKDGIIDLLKDNKYKISVVK